MRYKVFSAVAVGLALSACAGRDPHPVAVVQPQDQYSDCTMIKAEIDANNMQAQKLAEENGWKVAQNVLTGVGGVFFFPVWAAMDAKGAAGTEAPGNKNDQSPVADEIASALTQAFQHADLSADQDALAPPFFVR